MRVEVYSSPARGSRRRVRENPGRLREVCGRSGHEFDTLEARQAKKTHHDGADRDATNGDLGLARGEDLNGLVCDRGELKLAHAAAGRSKRFSGTLPPPVLEWLRTGC